jgi:hypothetical protein
MFRDLLTFHQSRTTLHSASEPLSMTPGEFCKTE